ncbi:MAG: RNA polymerase sigma factor [Bacteroidales bacterium]|jgi:RNA polymerase sigma-70 factor (ECF subfamily)|nr:RNA polymerase sigma factor [Bacteroidales bacterium]MDD4703002.1 RNA polymerase sigma factor [Bacteroidales bacterium]MDX9799269.1 RNA polymerase sigma factor [Bacteroidales bacterium]
MDDIQIAQEISKGNQRVFEDFFNSHKLKVMNLCYGMVHDRDVAEDLVQDIFVEIYSSAHKFQGKSRLSTWLYRIAINKTINYLRKEKYRKFFVSVDDNKHSLQTDFRADLNLEEQEKVKHMHKIIDSLPSKQKQALVLFIYDELPQKEIAEIMNSSVASVEVLVHRAKQKIKEKTKNIYGNII